MQRALRQWTISLLLVVAVAGAIADLGGFLDVSQRIVDAVKGAFNLGDGSPQLEFALRVGLLLAVVLLVVMVQWLLGADSPEAALAREQRADEKVRAGYLSWFTKEVQGRLDRSLHAVRFIDVGMQETPGAVFPLYQFAATVGGVPQTFDSIVDAYNAFDQRLLILGGPGAGKSTALLKLALQLVAQADDANAPVPLLINLSKFTPEGRGPRIGLSLPFRQQALSEDDELERWLIRQAAERPGVTLATARRWIQRGEVALLLDGLDEVNDQYLEQLVELLNRTYLFQHPDTPVVVCSRIIEYTPLQNSQEKQLWLNGTVTLQPFSIAQIRQYLDDAKLPALVQALDEDAVLLELARTPLTLSLMALAYSGGALDVRRDKGLPLIERRQRLLDSFVDEMMRREAFKRTHPERPYTGGAEATKPPLYQRATVDRHLSWMALQMSERMRTALPIRSLYAFLNDARSNNALSLLMVDLLLLAPLVGSLLLLAPPQSWPLLLATAVLAYAVGPLGDRIDGNPPLPFVVLVGFMLLFVGATLVVCITSLSAAFPVPIAPQILSPFALIAFFIFVVLQGETVTFRRSMLLRFGRSGLLLILVAGVVAWLARLPVSPADTVLLCMTAGIVVTLYFQAMSVNNPLSVLLVMGAILLALIAVAAPFFFITSVPAWFVLFVAVLNAVLWLAFFPARHQRTRLWVIIGGGTVGFLVGFALGGVTSAVVGALVCCFAAYLVRAQLTEPLERFLLNPLTLIALKLSRRLPLRLGRFLDYCARTFFIRRSEQEIEFIHRLLRDYFATNRLLPELQQATGARQIALIEQLSRQGDSAQAVLDELTTHSDPAVRIAAIAGLGRIATPEAVDALKRAFDQDSDVAVRASVLGNLQRVEAEEAVRLFEAAAADDDPAMRAGAARHLGGLLGRHRKASELVAAFYADPSDEVFAALISGLGQASLYERLTTAPNPTSISFALDLPHGALPFERLATLLAERDSRTRFACCWLLFEAGDTTNQPLVLDYLQECLTDPEPAVRFAAARALGRLSDAAALPILLRLFRSRQRRMREFALLALFDYFVAFRRQPLDRDELVELLLPMLRVGDVSDLDPLINTLAALGGTKVADAFTVALARTDALARRDALLRGLLLLPERRVTPALMRALQREPSLYRAAYVAASIEDAQLSAMMHTWLRGRRPKRRLAAARVLGLTRDAAAFDDFVAILQAPEPWWRRLAHRLGGEIDWLKAAAALAIGYARKQQSAPVLRQGLEARSLSVQIASAWALSHCSADEADDEAIRVAFGPASSDVLDAGRRSSGEQQAGSWPARLAQQMAERMLHSPDPLRSMSRLETRVEAAAAFRRE